ncbi:hypothetical protein [Candidatus Amarolinea dominans]|uniref:hypothetical protein n=1 Tax=Candidatus Amarolinea dominans TaxID=3140696 RepID=UPI001DF35C2F|nr:hypothetical protein [Anaerolineae bacterium]
MQRGGWSAGEAAARQAVALAPDGAVVWATLGDLEARWGALDSNLGVAEQAYQEASGRAPAMRGLPHRAGLICGAARAVGSRHDYPAARD